MASLIYLCSAEYWKPSLRKAAEELDVPMCPKPLPDIKLQTACQQLKEKGYKVLVIDDEASIRLAWEVIQEKLHIDKLYSYPNMESLLEEKLELRGIDIAFVDKNLEGSRFTGAEAVQYLKAQGVTKVVLASGESEEALRQDPQFAHVDFICNDKIPTSFKAFFS